MLRLTLDVNGRKIAQVGIHRTKRETDDSGRVQYDVYDLRDEPASFDDAPMLTSVQHDPDDGAIELTRIVVDELDERVTF